MNKSDNIAEIAKALCLAQAEMQKASKSTTNPFFKSKYADLEEVIDCVKSVFIKHGLSFTQMPGFDNGIVTVETMIMHDSGEWITSTCGCNSPKQDPQGVGSAITYLRRYSLSAVAGLAQEDDDGNSQQVGNNPDPIDLPWFNDFDKDAVQMAQLIAEGKRTPKQIIDNLCTKYKLSKEVRAQINALGGK